MKLERCLLTAWIICFWLYIFRSNFTYLYTYGRPKELLQYSNSSEEWELEQQRRKDTLRRFCSRTKGPQKMLKEKVFKDSRLLRHLLVDDKHRAIYCFIPKIGCSNWKRIWINLRGEPEAARLDEISHVELHSMTQRMRLHQANSKDDDEMKKMETYTKFIIVRNPMERLISAYLDKIHYEFGTEPFQAQVLPFVKKLRENAKLNDITLEEFLSFVSTPAGKINNHWISYERLCRPCQVDYDFILKLETIEEDAEKLLRLIRAPANLRYPQTEKRVTTTLAEKYMTNLTNKIISKVVKNFGNDFKMFGYDLHL